jgi:hypothetical protein
MTPSSNKNITTSFLEIEISAKRFIVKLRLAGTFITTKSCVVSSISSKTRYLNNCRSSIYAIFLNRSLGSHKEEVSKYSILNIAIIFDLDNVLVKSSYKKDKTREYDVCVYMSILNGKKIKVNY